MVVDMYFFGEILLMFEYCYIITGEIFMTTKLAKHEHLMSLLFELCILYRSF